MVATPAQMHDFHEDIATKNKFLFFERDEDTITSQPLNDVLLWVLVDERVIMSIIDLNLETESVFYLWKILND